MSTSEICSAVTLPPFSDGCELEVGHFCAVCLTLGGVLTRRQVTECTVRTTVIVIAAPSFDQIVGVGDRQEAVHVETFVAQPAVETLDKRVRRGLARPNEVERDAAPIGPFVQRLGREFGAVVDRDCLRQRTPRRQRGITRPLPDVTAVVVDAAGMIDGPFPSVRSATRAPVLSI